MVAATLPTLEDVYLPHRPKRRTVARERPLELLAETLLAQRGGPIDVAPFVDPEREV